MLCSTTMNNVHARICFMTPWVKPCPVKHGRSLTPRTTKLRIHEYQGHSVPLFEVSLGQTPASYTTLESIFSRAHHHANRFCTFCERPLSKVLRPKTAEHKVHKALEDNVYRTPKIKFPKPLKTICIDESSRHEDVTNEFSVARLHA